MTATPDPAETLGEQAHRLSGICSVRPLSAWEAEEIVNTLLAIPALLAERQQDCPAANECAINNGASHCFHCRRNWPRDETWEQPFTARPNLQRREIETLHGLLDVAEAERQQDKERIERLEKALVTAALPLEVLRGQIAVKPYRELTAAFQQQIVEATDAIRAALAVEEDAENG